MLFGGLKTNVLISAGEGYWFFLLWGCSLSDWKWNGSLARNWKFRAWMRTCFMSDSIVGAVTSSVSVFQFVTYLREGLTMPFRMVKLWKSLARGKLLRFSFVSSELQGSAGGSGHRMTTWVSVMCENKNVLAADFSPDNYFLRSTYYGWGL